MGLTLRPRISSALARPSNIDVARCVIRALGYGTIDKGATNKLGIIGQGGTQDIRQPKGLEGNTPEFLKDGRLPVGLIMFLAAFQFQCDPPGRGHPFKFALQRPAPGLCSCGNFIGVEGLIRLAEEQPKHPLQYAREQDIRN